MFFHYFVFYKPIVFKYKIDNQPYKFRIFDILDFLVYHKFRKRRLFFGFENVEFKEKGEKWLKFSKIPIRQKH